MLGTKQTVASNFSRYTNIMFSLVDYACQITLWYCMEKGTTLQPEYIIFMHKLNF